MRFRARCTCRPTNWLSGAGRSRAITTLFSSAVDQTKLPAPVRRCFSSVMGSFGCGRSRAAATPGVFWPTRWNESAGEDRRELDGAGEFLVGPEVPGYDEAAGVDGDRGMSALGCEGVAGRAPGAERRAREGDAEILHRPGAVGVQQRVA